MSISGEKNHVTKSYRDADMRCPYFLRIDPSTCHITCEGVLPGQTYKGHFQSKAAMYEAAGRRCAGDFKACPWYRLLTGGKY